jgi:3-oxoacyl-[acyl-carrier-protein] synthase III
MRRSVITGSGSYIPGVMISNSHFESMNFYSEKGSLLDTPVMDIVRKFGKITGILERRYAERDIRASDMAAEAAAIAIADSSIDAETIDQIIVAHNFGDIASAGSAQLDIVPSLASRVKRKLGICNPDCIPHDLIFGCPGWLQGLIHADAYCRAGMAKNALVIGTETLSRVIDPHDRDSMIFSDGAGACILEYKEEDGPAAGILSAKVRSDCEEETEYITLGGTHHPATDGVERYIKMKGRKVYEYALRHVPPAMKACLDASGFGIQDLKAIFIHQANEKMDEAIVKSFYELYGIMDVPAFVMPMCIQWLGNNSVATIPTLFDLVRKNNMPDHRLEKGDLILFASVGAGMNINAVCYGYC